MLRNILTVALRNFVRQRGYTLLNLFGLALGLGTSLLIFGYVRVDLTWDRFHENTDQIVRVVELQDFGQKELTDVAVTMGPLGPMLKAELPEVVAQTRYHTQYQIPIQRGDEKFFSGLIGYVDPDFFEMFDFKVQIGDLNSALNRPDALVLTQTAVKRYLPGVKDPFGQVILVQGRPVVVTAVIEDPPVNSHFTFEALAPFEAMKEVQSVYASWGSNNLSTYLMLTPEADPDSLGPKITEAYHRHGSWEGLKFYAQPLTDMHLHSEHIEIDRNWGKSSVNQVIVMISISLLILLIAIINFVNLATARSIRRSREVGLRKVVGAQRNSLILQFLGESMLTALIAMLIAGLGVQLLLPSFQNLSGREVPLNVIGGGFATWMLLVLTLLTGLLAGLYPAIILSAYRPVEVLKGTGRREGKRGSLLRRALVLIQFSITIALIIATTVVYQQADFIRNTPLGYDKQGVLVLPLRGEEASRQAQSLAAEFEKYPDVEAVTVSSRLPTRGGSQSGMLFEGETESRMTNWILADPKYAEVMGLQLTEGRFFDKEFPSDLITEDEEGNIASGALVVNETAVQQAGWDDAVGKTIRFWGTELPVIGVVRDFHFASLYTPIAPMVIANYERYPNYLSMRYISPNVNELLGSIEEEWSARLPALPFDYFFLDADYDRYYRTQQRQAQMLRAFAMLAIVIALLGLVGLINYSTERRTKEIGVRKVLGATEGQIIGLVTREFTRLVIYANLLAWPVTWFSMKRWLDEFAYHVPLNWWLFPLAGILALVVAWFGLAVVAWRASLTDPVDALHYE